MRILLDEYVPRGLKRLLEGHDAKTVAEKGRCIAVVILVAKTNQMVDYIPLQDKLRIAIQAVEPGRVQWVSA